MSSGLTKEEAFHNGYRRFLDAIEILAKPAEQQCEIMGYYNVAWELKDDVSSGLYLFDISDQYLNEEKKLEIRSLVADVEKIPKEAFEDKNSTVGSLKAMQHPAWELLRVKASSLLKTLESVTRENDKYFN